MGAEAGRAGDGDVWVIIVAAGSGRRYGGAKQYERLGRRRVLDWSLDAARARADGVVLVVAADASREEPADRVVVGGATRSGSVRAGLAVVPTEAGVILVHDAARPLASPDLFAAVIEAVRTGSAAVVPGVPVVDTIRHREGGVIDRSELVAVQTPQGFRASALREAHARASEATDDAGLVEDAGYPVTVVEGEPANRKVTTPADLVVAEALVRAGSATGSEEAS